MKQKHLNIILILLIGISIFECKSTLISKRTEQSKNVSNSKLSPDVKQIIKDAKKYLGTKYKYGGDGKRGIDCSGLVQNVFKNQDINLPRSSKDQSLKGKWIDVKNIVPGDLVFFATQRNSRTITHVGIVTEIKGKFFKFIHSSTSKGVIISSLDEKYWYRAYVQARRIL